MKPKNYQADEFLYDTKPDPIEVTVDKKVSLLYDCCILYKSTKGRDAREAALREILSQYTSERALTTALHDVVVGNKPIDIFIAQKQRSDANDVQNNLHH